MESQYGTGSPPQTPSPKRNMGRKIVFTLLIGIFLLVGYRIWTFKIDLGQETEVTIRKESVLHLELHGIILNGKKFLKSLKKYGEKKSVKAIVVSINSPGGAVGPSEEIFIELKRLKEKSKKPLICVSTGVIASGAYYAAAACDKIVVAAGALVGSIGVIMEFANLEKLYDWAKISRFSISSGKFKDSGAEYRPMREEEKSLFQEMINDVYQQFRDVVKSSRGLSDEVMNEYADGRVFTGSKAVSLGFADQVGTLQDAFDLAAQTAGLGSDYEIFELPKRRHFLWDFANEEEEDPINVLFEGVTSKFSLKTFAQTVFRPELLNQPLFLMPGFWPSTGINEGQ